MYKRGTDKIISVYWFAILFIVAGAIAYMVFLFYGGSYNVRDIEVSILIDQVVDCLADSGKLKPDRFNSDFFKNNFLEVCDLTFDVEDEHGWREKEQYYVKIDFYNFDSGVKENFFVEKGNINLIDCSSDKESLLSYCQNRSFYVLDDNNITYKVKILASINKIEKNAG